MSCISINLKKEETIIKIEDNATKEEIINELDEKYGQKITAVEKSIDSKIDEAISKQSREIAAEFQNLIQYLDKRFRKIENKLDEEIRTNKIAHNSYEARFYKVEVNQDILDNRVKKLETAKK